jgi:DNA-binding CsgD family transcriptional regulator
MLNQNPAGLTNRQLEALALMAGGLSNAEIAERLFISPKTAEHHVSATLAKLDARTRAEAIRRTARRNNLPVDSITKVRVLDPYFYR